MVKRELFMAFLADEHDVHGQALQVKLYQSRVSKQKPGDNAPACYDHSLIHAKEGGC